MPTIKVNTDKRDAIRKAITETANDITAYLQSDVPLECYASDIDTKLSELKARIDFILNK